MKRFGKGERRQMGPILSVGGFLLAILLFWVFLQDLSESTLQRQRAQLETALERCILSCYTLEGSYPESLAYLKEHYPLRYNEELFFVDYQIQGANMLPDVTILEKGEH